MGLFYAVINLQCLALLTYEIALSMRALDKSIRQRMLITTMITLDISILADMLYGLTGAGWHYLPGIGNILCYAQNLFTTYHCFLWFIYSEGRQNERYFYNKRNFFLLALPFLLITVLVLTGMCFSYGPDLYSRKPLFILEAAINYGFIGYTGVKALYRSFCRKYYERRMEYRMLGMVLFLPLFFSLGQMLLGGEVPLLCIGWTFCYVMLFQNQQSEMISRDSLTGINNRTAAVHYLSSRIATGGEGLFLMMMDADHFKMINDEYGHVAGDQALVQIARVLKQVVPAGYIIARYGGDEFMCAGTAKDNNEIEELIQRLQSAMYNANRDNGKPWKVAMSIGYACFSDDMKTIPDLIEAADDALYKVKMQRKDMLR